LGGRLDATNVVERPALCVITPVSSDHTQYLGDTIEAIAFEKAGILKPKIPAVIAPQPPGALAVIEARAAELSSPLFVGGRDWRFERLDGGELRFAFRGESTGYPAPRLYGPHQAENAAVALAAATLLKEQGFPLDEAARKRGLEEAQWPARLQRLEPGPLTSLLPEGWELWLDGGHNESAGRALAAALDSWSEKPLYLVYGMLNTKAAGAFLAPLAARARQLKAVAIPGEANSLSAEQAAGFARAADFEAEPCGGIAEALRAIAAEGKGPARVLICGSLYLAGKVLALNEA
jgi:dihydrofolate synthase/folylpolyglutamate synthase